MVKIHTPNWSPNKQLFPDSEDREAAPARDQRTRFFFDSRIIHSRVEMVYVGTRSPRTGTNSRALIRVDRLLLVMLKSKAVTITSGISPITGIANIGAAR